MKNIKKICVLLAAVFVFSSVLCCTAFATGVSEGYVIDTDVVYAELPDDYTLDFVDNYFYFSDDDFNSIVVEAIENKAAPDGITELTEEFVKGFFLNVYLLEGDETYADYYKLEDVTAKKTKVNGISAYELIGKYAETDDCGDENCEDVYVYPFCSYIFATKENIVMVTYEECEDKAIDTEDINQVLATLAINGTYFDGDVPTVTHDFSTAPAYKDALLKADEEMYFEDGDLFGGDEEFAAETMFVTKFVMIIIFVVPFVIVAVVAVIMIIVYAKNKKKLNEYELKYGSLDSYNPYMQQNMGAYNYNAGAATNNGYVPYVQNPVQQNPVTPNMQNGAPNMMPEMNNGDTPKTGSYPATENQVPVQPENEQQ